jgi:hypothetical protein
VAPKLFLLLAAVVVCSLAFAVVGSSAHAKAVPVKITNCNSAIGAMNAALINTAKARVAARKAKSKSAKKRTKRNLKKAQSRGNNVRTAIRKHCIGANSLSSKTAACELQITKLTKSIETLYTRKLQTKKVKGKKSKRTRKTQLKRLADRVKADTKAFKTACAGSPGDGSSGAGPTGPTGNSGAPDTTAPGPVTIVGPTGPTNDNTPTVEITTPETGGHLECKINNGAFVTVTSPWTLPALADGTYTITCHYVDGSGNVGPDTSFTITIDTTAPGAVTIQGPNGSTNDSTPTITLGSGETGGHFECKINGGAFTTVTSPWTLPALADGTYTVTCHYVDGAGNVGPDSSITFTIDTVGPITTITGSNALGDNTPTFTLSSTEPNSTFKCKVDSGSFQNVAGSTFTTLALLDGSHNVFCNATDAAGNTGPTTAKSTTVIVGTPFADPTTVTGTGKIGIACTPLEMLNNWLGCPSMKLKIVIPAHPNGLTGNYLTDVSGFVKDLGSKAGILPKYTISITVDGTPVASQSKSMLLDLCGGGNVDLAASKTNISLSSDTAHTVTLYLKSSALLSVLPSAGSAALTVDLH